MQIDNPTPPAAIRAIPLVLFSSSVDNTSIHQVSQTEIWDHSSLSHSGYLKPDTVSKDILADSVISKGSLTHLLHNSQLPQGKETKLTPSKATST